MSKHPGPEQQRRGNGQSQQRRDPQPPADGHIDDLATPYVLGALDEATARTVKAHIAQCAICQRFVTEARHTASFLPFLASPAAPRPEVKLSLFARIAQSAAAQCAAELEQTSQPLPLGGPAPAADMPSFAPPASRWQAVRRRLHVPLQLGRVSEGVGMRPAYAATLSAVPFLVALTVVGMWAMSLHGQLHDAKDQVAQLDARVNTMSDLVADNTQSFYEYQLTGGPAAPQASGKIYADPEQSVATLMVWNLARSARQQPYEIYVEQNGQLVPVGQLTVDSSGKGSATIRLNGSLAQYRSIHIKAESASNSTSSVDFFTNPSINDALSTELDARVGNMADTTAP